jgi:hypothetical protein
MRRLRLLGWIGLGAAVGVGVTLTVVALTDDDDQSGVVRIPVQVNVAAKVAGQWAAEDKRPGEKVETYGCEGDEAPKVESRFACHVRFTRAGAQTGREVTLYIVNTDRPLVVEVLKGEHHLPYRAAIYEKPRP